MRISVAAFSEQGDRPINEDAFNFSANEELGCFILADGAGGHGCGELASQAVVGSMLQAFTEHPAIEMPVLQRGLDRARAQLASGRQLKAEARRMDSTVACMLLDAVGGNALWLQLGDSRIYLFRNHRAHLLTRDHSVLQSFIDAGMYRGSVRGAAGRSRLYASVGEEALPPCMMSETPVPVADGDVFLLCSDGFWDNIDEQEMASSLQRARNPREWLRYLFVAGASVEGGWRDNATAMAVWVGCKDNSTFTA